MPSSEMFSCSVSRTVPANERAELLQCASSTFTVSDDQIEELSVSVREVVSRILGKDVTGFKRLRVEPSGRIVLLTWGKHPRLQLLTVAELLDGKGIDYPRTVNVTFKTAPKAKGQTPENLALSWEAEEAT